MVAVESLHQANSVEDQLIHHWGLDEMASNELAHGVSQDGRLDILGLSEWVESEHEAVQLRDMHRDEISAIYRGDSDKQMVVVGPCSLEGDTDYGELFDYISQLQEENPDTIVVFRGNGSKPRTSGGWRGQFHELDPKEQEKLLTIYQDAFKRGIPIVTEVTDKDDFIYLAPYLSGAWLGARDMQNTLLHATLSATNIPIAVKNPKDGNTETIRNVITAIGKNTHGNDDDPNDKGYEGSGVNLGFLSYTYKKGNSVLPSNVAIQNGNKNVAIIARGYEVDMNRSAKSRAKEALRYIGKVCTLGAEINAAVLIDGQHDVPPMFDIDKKVGDRFIRVMNIIMKAARKGKIENAHMLRGFIAELGPDEGRTDRNLLLEEAKAKNSLGKLINRWVKLGNALTKEA